MATVSSQSPFFHSLKPNTTNNFLFSSSSPSPSPSSSKPTPRKNSTLFKTLKATSSSSSSSPNSEPENPSIEQKLDRVKLALEKAKAYRKSVQLGSNPVVNSVQDPVLDSNNLGSENDEPASGFIAGNSEIAKEKKESFLGAKNELSVLETRNGDNGEVPSSIKLALEKAKEYKKNKGIAINDKGVEKSRIVSGKEDQNQEKSGNSILSEKLAGKKKEQSVSSIDFVGLGFADKKISRGLPPGLVPISEPFPDGDLPEVEILVGDTSRFRNDSETKKGNLIEEDDSETYKPKVSTWGVFPRPSNISKTYGGGRVIRPGEQLETEEDKAAKQKRTREMIAAYRKRTGLTIDPKLKLECKKALEEGDYLMDLGKLKEALNFYQEVMNKLPFQTELHGVAALQWSICQDSLSRSNEAQVMYEKLQSHPTVNVRKKAKQFVFGFQAMEMLKVKSSGSALATNTGYQNFFEAFIERKDNYPIKDAEIDEQGEEVLGQAIPYIVFLVSPIFLVLLFAVRKGI